MTLLTWIIGVISLVASCVLLYFIIKTAVKNAILEANSTPSSAPAGSRKPIVKQTTCAKCNKSYDMDYRKCPYCGSSN